MKAHTGATMSLLLISCSTTRDVAAEKQAILARDHAWRAAIQARDAKAIVDFWTEDAVLFDAQRPPTVGRPALLGMVQGALQDPKFKIQWEDGRLTVAASGDIAFQVTTNRVTTTGPADGEVVEQADSVAIWRKDADGLWRCAVDISTPAAKPAR